MKKLNCEGWESHDGDHAEPLGAWENERDIQRAAAQLRLVTDRRLGKLTPEWVQKLAAESPAVAQTLARRCDALHTPPLRSR